MIDFETHGLAYVARGLAVFPVEGRGKKPLTEHGCRDASLDEATIRAWARRSPTANVGIATGLVSGGLVVVDIDVSKRGDVVFAELVREHGPIPFGPEVATGGGGSHFYFRSTAYVSNSRDRVGVGIDVRGEGGYVVAPPSIHATGARYAWLANGAASVPELTGWLLQACIGSGSATSTSALAPDFGRYGTRDDLRKRLERAVRYVDRVDPAVSGAGGHDQTWIVAQHLVRGFELPVECALEVLRHFNLRCTPPWGERELAHKIHSAAHQSKATAGYLSEARA